MTGMHERAIALDGCFNVRDLGGYPAPDGRWVRWRTIFRADGLHRLSPAGLEGLAELGLRTVIDLRTPAEVDERGRVEAGSGVAYHHLPMIDVLPPAEDLERWLQPRYVAEQYAEMLRAGAPAIRQALDLLGDPERYPVAYHCMAGKDRTGILSAVVLGLLGVPDEEIIRDYALSRDGMEALLDWLRETQPEAVAAAGVNVGALVAAEPETMACFLDTLRSEHGGVEAYVASLGVPRAGDHLRELLLEGPAPAG